MKKQKSDWFYLMFCISFLGIMLLQLVVRVKAIKDNYLLYTSIFVVLMLVFISLLIAFRKKERVKRSISFSIPFLCIWLSMCGYMLYSDIAVFKKYCFLSLILLVLFTGIFIIFQFYRRDARDKLFSVFIASVEIAFIFATIFCILFRPYTTGVRYSGLSANPNVYGMFLITVWVCFITRLDYNIANQKSIIKCLSIYAGIGCSLFFLYMTGARTSFMAIAFMTMFWFIFRLIYQRKKKETFIKYFAVMIPVVIASFFISYGLLATIPHLINRPVVFERDRDFLADAGDTNVCYASENTPSGALNEIEHDVENAIENADKEPSLIKRIKMIFKGGESLDTILNGRLTIYKNFSAKINMKGNQKYGKKVNGTFVVNAHNNIIQVGYNYGIPAMILYIILNALSLIYSIRNYVLYHDRLRCAAFPMLITLGFLITSLTECLLLPMQSLLAFAYYLSVGEIMNTQKN